MNSSEPDNNPPKPLRVPLHELLDFEPIEAVDGRARVELRVDQPHMRSLAIMHGGVFAALLDAAQGMAASSAAPSGCDVVTVQLNVNFLRSVGVGERLVATGEVLHSGRRTAVTRGEVRTSEGALAATGSATLMFLSIKGGPDAGGIGPVPPDHA